MTASLTFKELLFLTPLVYLKGTKPLSIFSNLLVLSICPPTFLRDLEDWSTVV